LLGINKRVVRRVNQLWVTCYGGDRVPRLAQVGFVIWCTNAVLAFSQWMSLTHPPEAYLKTVDTSTTCVIQNFIKRQHKQALAAP